MLLDKKIYHDRGQKENFMIDTAVSITSIRNPITMQNQTAILGAIALRAGDQL